ncbi:MAG: glycerophosphodiester phosphodiesterase [Rhodothermales bacterium]|nr:glycerophosphodiester phosphodiesterase [Rhodothermales bacterium]
MTADLPDTFDAQGHRGARGLLPENTVDGMLLALDLGMTTLEMDVVISSDGVVVLSHDPTMSADICSHPDGRPVSPLEDGDLILYEMTLEQIQAFDCGLRGHPDFPQQQPRAASKPALTEVFSAAEKHALESGRPLPFYNIETKSSPSGDGVYHPGPAQFTAALMTAAREAGVSERVTIQSFDERTLVHARTGGWEGALSLLVGRHKRGGYARHMRRLGFMPDIYSPDHRLVDEQLIAETRDAGIRLVPWTVNEVDRMIELIELGVDGLITDYPDRLAVLIAESDA